MRIRSVVPLLSLLAVLLLLHPFAGECRRSNGRAAQSMRLAGSPSAFGPRAAGSLPPIGQNGGDPVPDPKAVVMAPGGLAKFTVLTPYIIRMQYAPDGNFNGTDVQTYVVLNRALSVPHFTQQVQGSALIISTGKVLLRYDSSDRSSFNGHNLQVTVLDADGQGGQSVWMAAPGMDQQGNLYGTLRTLDQFTWDNGTDKVINCDLNQDPNSHCSWGVIGTKGYAVIDDTGSPAFDAPQPDTWTWLRAREQSPVDPSLCPANPAQRRNCAFNGVAADECGRRGCCFDNSTQAAGVPVCFYSTQSAQDLYFFGHGLNFKQALLEYTWLGGKIPAPPRYQFGVYFSRYWAYADYEEYDLVQSYIDHQIPLDVLVTDMDWHKTFYSQAQAGVVDQAGEAIGWSGFTFDDGLFANHTEFLLWCKSMGLINTLNVHPASGIQPWEEKYPEMCAAMGQDPKSGLYVPYNATDFTFNQNWLKIVMQPMEQEGVDFWWLDWQQGEQWIEQARLNPTQMLNYVFYSNPNHWSNGRRPAILHRWGGLGNHRYQVGFSGDVWPSWNALAFQPYFTATAANVGYTYWSHDIGGHQSLPAPDLYTRWVQFGMASPILRNHCTKDSANYRLIWLFPDENYKIMRKFMRLRAALVPYLADHALNTYDTGLGLVLPLYYNWPLSPEAYTDLTEQGSTYMFGNSLLASPIVAPVDNATQLAFKDVWIPPGQWVHFFDGDLIQGPQTVTLNATIAEMPLYAVAGSIIPLRPLPASSAPGTDLIGSARLLPSTLQLLTFVSADFTTSGRLVLREDAGDNLNYQLGEWATTEASFELSGEGNKTLLYTIAQTQVFPGFMQQRAYEIHLRGVYAAASVSIDGGQSFIPFQPFHVQENQVAGQNTWSYDATTLTLVIHLRVPVPTSAGNKVHVVVQLTDSPNCPYLNKAVGFAGRIARVQSLKGQLDNLWRTPSQVYQDLYPNFLRAAETSSRIAARPMNAMKELAKFDELMGLACTEMRNLTCMTACLPNLVEMLTAQLNC